MDRLGGHERVLTSARRSLHAQRLRIGPARASLLLGLCAGRCQLTMRCSPPRRPAMTDAPNVLADADTRGPPHAMPIDLIASQFSGAAGGPRFFASAAGFRPRPPLNFRGRSVEKRLRSEQWAGDYPLLEALRGGGKPRPNRRRPIAHRDQRQDLPRRCHIERHRTSSSSGASPESGGLALDRTRHPSANCLTLLDF
jgi:hypothetical protein